MGVKQGTANKSQKPRSVFTKQIKSFGIVVEENIHLITVLHDDGCHIWGILMLKTCTILQMYIHTLTHT